MSNYNRKWDFAEEMQLHLQHIYKSSLPYLQNIRQQARIFFYEAPKCTFSKQERHASSHDLKS